MPQAMQSLIDQYISEIKAIYGSHLQKVILYGSYARGDFRPDSDVDIMILLDMSDLDLKAYSQKDQCMIFKQSRISPPNYFQYLFSYLYLL